MNHKPFATTELKPLTDAVRELAAERDDFSARYETASRLIASLSDAWANALKERDALKDAARLALDALDASQGYCSGTHTEDAVKKAIAALKAVL